MEIITRSEARQSGAKRYLTGLPCLRGHVGERATVNGTCLACMNQKAKDRGTEYARNQYQLHADIIRANSKTKSSEKRRFENPARVDARRMAVAARSSAIDAGKPTYFSGKACKYGHNSSRFTSNRQCVKCASVWRSEHRAICNKLSAEWVGRNPEKAALMSRVSASVRRARKSAAGGRHTCEEVVELAKRQKYRCANPSCRISIRKLFHEDHIIPIVLGGTSCIRNIQLLCPPCNLKKGSKDPIAWAQQI